MGDYGAKVSKSGKDVKTAAVADQIFNSEKTTVKISHTGTVESTLGAGGGSATWEVPHGFSFVPGFLVWYEIDGNGEWYFMYTSGGFNDYVNCNPYSDATNLTIPLINNGASQHTVKAYYAILADEGA